MTMHSLASFASHLESLVVGVVAAQHAALEHAAKAVEAEAKSEFGVYQDGIAGFPAWANLAEATVMDRIAKGFTPDDPLLRTGTLRDTISREVHLTAAAVGSTDDVMVYQELGTATIPPRPVLGPALARKHDFVLEVLGGYTAGALLKGSAIAHPLIAAD